MLFSGNGKAGMFRRVSVARPIAVDFGVRAMKVLQVGAGDSPALVAAASVTTPDELLSDFGKRLEFQLEQLPKQIGGEGFKGRRVACLIPSASTFCKHMQVALGDGVNVQAVLESAIPAELNCPVEALVIRSHEVALAPKNVSGRTELICMATPSELVRRIMERFSASKLQLVGLYPELLSLMSAFTGVGAVEAEPTMYIDLGWSMTRVVIAHGGELVFARAIEMGGQQLDEAVRDSLGVDMVRAGGLRREMETLVGAVGAVAEPTGMAALGTSLEPAATETAIPDCVAGLAEPLEMLTDEISMCLRYHGSVFPGQAVARVVFVGGESRHRALCEHISRSLRMAGHTADPISQISRSGNEPISGVSFGEPQPGWTAVLGASFCQADL